MNNKELTSALATATKNRKEETTQLLETAIALMTDHLVKGDIVQLAKLGSFQVYKKMERVIINPGTGKRMLVPPKLALGFKPYLAIKEKIGKSEEVMSEK